MIRAHWVFLLAAWFASVTISTTSGQSTTIVGIRTPELVVIAGDSVGTFRGGSPEKTRLVCKVFTVGGAGFAISGLSRDVHRGFDAEAIVASALWHRESIRGAMIEIQNELSNALLAELERLKKEDPTVYEKSLQGLGGYVISVLIAAFEGREPVASAIAFKGQENPSGRIGLTTIYLNCPGDDCPGGTLTFFLGERGAIDRYTAKHGKNFNMPPEEGAPFLVELEIMAGTSGVGPPIDVLKITKEGPFWVTRKAGCADSPVGFKHK